MRKILIAALVAGALASGAAAATIFGTARAELLVGTPKRDTIVAGGGNDRVAVQYDRVRDTVRCGRGRDVVTADRVDAVARDCEIVSRLISRDTYRTPDGQHETQVEPHALAAGSTVVATFQSGRRRGGGAADIGFSRSRDGGRSWQGGHLPSLTVSSRPAGTAAYASDPVVAFDARRGVWLISTLAVSAGLTELYISRSTDGLRWSPPVVAARFASGSLAFDKNWAACDTWPQSPFFGRCYLAYTVHVTRTPRMDVQFSDDGGLTWSDPIVAVRSPEVVGVLPLPRPDGSLVVPYLGPNEMQSVRSTDGGRTFEQPVTIAGYEHRPVRGIRSFPLPTADVDGQGRVYIAWDDCGFRSGCAVNDVVLSTSADGVTWSRPARVTRDGEGSDFVPALAVDRASGRLALAYHRCTGSPCRIDLLLSRSRDGGASWGRPQLVSAQPMRTAWLPTTTSGRMLGDYIGLSWSRGRPVAVYSLASQPRGGALRQAIAAASVP